MVVAPLPASDVRSLLKAIRTQIGRLRPELSPNTSTYDAALLLLTAPVVGQGVHKLAAVTGLAPEFVARCARRLVDNSVWVGGRTLSPWAESDGDDDSFWLDVGVAEGRLCRRRDDAGLLEWAPAGHWWKEFEFVARRERAGEGVRYHTATAAPPSLPMPSSAPDEVEIPSPALRGEMRMRTPSPEPSRGTTGRSEGWVEVGQTVVVGGTTLPDTVWLS